MSDNPHARALVEGALVVPLPDRMSLGMQAGIAGVVFMSWIMRADVARGLRGGREGGAGAVPRLQSKVQMAPVGMAPCSSMGSSPGQAPPRLYHGIHMARRLARKPW